MASLSARRRRNDKSKFSASTDRRQYLSCSVDGLPRRRVQRPAIVTFILDRNEPVLPRRLAEQSIFPDVEIRNTSNRHGPLRSTTGTSMLVSCSEHTSSHDLAALTTSPSLAASESEHSSFGVRQLEYQNPRRLANGEGGVPVVDYTRTEGNFECPFNFLLCLRTFAKMDDWIRHSMTHFGRAGPPDSNQCCFCPARFSPSPSMSSWARRMEHISCHHRLGSRLADARPDFELYNYLWNKHLLSDADYRDLKGNQAGRSQAAQAYPSPPESPEERVYTDTYSSSRARRGRGRQN